jgi:hypothetical protein
VWGFIVLTEYLSSYVQYNPGCVAAVMGHSAQAALANTLFRMKVRRSEFLELPWV